MDYRRGEIDHDLEAMTRAMTNIKIGMLDMCAKIGLDYDRLRRDSHCARFDEARAAFDARVAAADADMLYDNVSMCDMVDEVCEELIRCVTNKDFGAAIDAMISFMALYEVFGTAYSVDMGRAFALVFENMMEMIFISENAANDVFLDKMASSYFANYMCIESPVGPRWTVFNVDSGEIVPPNHWREADLREALLLR